MSDIIKKANFKRYKQKLTSAPQKPIILKEMMVEPAYEPVITTGSVAGSEVTKPIATKSQLKELLQRAYTHAQQKSPPIEILTGA